MDGWTSSSFEWSIGKSRAVEFGNREWKQILASCHPLPLPLTTSKATDDQQRTGSEKPRSLLHKAAETENESWNARRATTTTPAASGALRTMIDHAVMRPKEIGTAVEVVAPRRTSFIQPALRLHTTDVSFRYTQTQSLPNDFNGLAPPSRIPEDGTSDGFDAT